LQSRDATLQVNDMTQHALRRYLIVLQHPWGPEPSNLQPHSTKQQSSALIDCCSSQSLTNVVPAGDMLLCTQHTTIHQCGLQDGVSIHKVAWSLTWQSTTSGWCCGCEPAEVGAARLQQHKQPTSLVDAAPLQRHQVGTTVYGRRAKQAARCVLVVGVV
jgi:hypothetical protein